MAWQRARRADCRLSVADGIVVKVTGAVSGPAGRGRFVLDAEGGLPGGCRGAVTVLLPRPSRGDGNDAEPRQGARVVVHGRWSRRFEAPRDPARAGEIVSDLVLPLGPGGSPLLEQKGRVGAVVRTLYPRRYGLVSALILARKEGLDPSLREVFARAGTAHLLAISGFHVGVIAAMILAALRGVGVPPRLGVAIGAAGVWAYVLFIGVPDAAARAAVILSLVGLGLLLGRPLSQLGLLATAFLVLLLSDAGALARPGFQLSFAGAAGLAALAGDLEKRLAVLAPYKGARGLRSALAAGVAATLVTLPVVAWHFDRVSLVGIPATLVSAPLVAVAVPGALLSVAAHGVSPALGSFLAGGVDTLLIGLLAATRALAGLPFAVAWVPRSWILAGFAGAGVVLLLLSRTLRMGRGIRFLVVLGGTASAVLLLPVATRIASRGTTEFRFLDVGQGDAILIRTPASRWLLVDAGPAPALASGSDPPVLRGLKRAGVAAIAALVLTHPDLDHIGGAAAVLDAFRVGVVLDPGRARGTSSFIDVLEAAEREGGGWHTTHRGDVYDVDGLEVRVLHPLAAADVRGPEGSNETSVVLLVRFGAFEALLTGDAPVAVEEAAATRSGPVEVLKVGHHGSRTSTSKRFLAEVRPQVAVISVGRRNRYGHPHREVVARLLGAGVELHRTDLEGTVRILARPDGTFSVR